jgi:hypothetical protein
VFEVRPPEDVTSQKSDDWKWGGTHPGVLHKYLTGNGLHEAPVRKAMKTNGLAILKTAQSFGCDQEGD